jgi:glycerophosphoryl diester phosphodiesterase
MATASALQRIAHRGASVERLENTLSAFKLAMERGADAVELDVHLTRDNVVVVHHDPEVGGWPIRTTDWADLAEVKLEDDERIPRLEDVMRAIGDRLEVYIELKGEDVGPAAIELARRRCRRFAVHSFDHSAIERSLNSAPDVARGVLLDRGTPDAVAAMMDACRRVKPRDVWPHYSLVDARFMNAATKLGVRVIVWTVNTTDEARRLSNLGVAGVCGDDVRMFVNL